MLVEKYQTHKNKKVNEYDKFIEEDRELANWGIKEYNDLLNKEEKEVVIQDRKRR